MREEIRVLLEKRLIPGVLISEHLKDSLAAPIRGVPLHKLKDRDGLP